MHGTSVVEEEKAVLKEKVQKCGRPLTSFNDTFRTALDFLASPCNLWHSDRLEDKRAVLKLAFAGRVSYVRKKGFSNRRNLFTLQGFRRYFRGGL